MQRHIFGPLFEPQSILVITDQQLPLAQSLPAAEHPKLTKVQVQKGRPIEIPSELAGATAEQCLDLAVLCVDPARLAETLDQLARYRPRAAILLQSERVDSRPEQTITLCRRWATLHGCLMIGPQSFGILRPHLGLNLSLNPTLAREGRVAFVAQSSAIVSSVLDSGVPGDRLAHGQYCSLC